MPSCLPNDNTTFFCNFQRSTCYMVTTGTAQTFATQQELCESKGGWLVTYQSGKGGSPARPGSWA
jgi:hypothetical protein